jgi:hypothetical protein
MPDTTLKPQMRVRRIDNVLDADIDDETVIMDIDQGRYFGFNETGTRIWSSLVQPIVIRDLCDQLTAEFNVPQEQCEQEVFDFLASLLTRGLLQVMTDETS